MKNAIILILFSLFLITTFQLSAQVEANLEDKVNESTIRISEKLGLDGSQELQLFEINKEAVAKLNQLKIEKENYLKQIKEKYKVINQVQEQSLVQILDPAQMKKYQDWKRESLAKKKLKMKK